MSDWNDPMINNEWDGGPADLMDEEMYEMDDYLPSNESVKEVAGKALAKVDGILGLKSGFTDIFKADEDLTRGISVHVYDDESVNLSAKVIAELGHNSANLINDATAAVTSAVQSQLGLAPEKINIEIADTLTRAEFDEKYGAKREIH